VLGSRCLVLGTGCWEQKQMGGTLGGEEPEGRGLLDQIGNDVAGVRHAVICADISPTLGPDIAPVS